MEGAIETMALGRPFRLGMLYDCRSEKLIPGMTLWSPDDLNDNIESDEQQTIDSTFITEDSLNDKAHSLGVEASLKLSVLSGLFEVSGSAKYANDRKTSNQQERVTLKYSSTICFKRLTMKHLSKEKMIYTDVFDIDIATHVVTGIVYGVDAFFIFDRVLSANDNKTNAQGEVKAILDKIPKCGVSGVGKLDLNEQEKKTVKSLSYKFYGDFAPDKNPSTFDEAVELYRLLPTLCGHNGERAVAKRVYLYPLSLLNNKPMKIIREINASLVDDCISFMDSLHDLKVQANDLIHDHCPAIHQNKKYLDEFVHLITRFEADVKQRIIELMLQIRSTANETADLANFLAKVRSPPFHRQALVDWVNCKRREIMMTEGFIRPIIIEKYADSTPDSLIRAISNIKYDIVVCLSLHMTSRNDLFLNDFSDYLEKKTGEKKQYDTLKPLVYSETVVESSRKNTSFFLELAKANKMNQKIKFIIDDQYIDKEKNREGILIDLYQNSVKIKLTMPSKPSKPSAVEIYHDRILLTWEKPSECSKDVQKYNIIYTKKDDTNWRSSLTVTSDTESKLIQNLSRNTEYLFKVQIMTKIGVLLEGDLSNPILTRSSIIPNIPLNARWAQNGETVAGGHKEGNGINQLSYPYGIFVDDDQMITIVDSGNHRVVQRKIGDKNGHVIAGGHDYGKALNQLNGPTDMVIDSQTHSVLICDYGNQRVQRWPLNGNASEGEILLENIDCSGLAMDDQRNLYISNTKKNEIRRYQMGEQNGTLVAGGHGEGAGLNQFDQPTFMFVDQEQSIYVTDNENHRVLKWNNGATTGTIVAGGQGPGDALTQLCNPTGLFVDTLGNIYVGDSRNNRIMRWHKGAMQGTVVVGGNGLGDHENQLNSPTGLSFDCHGNLYVADYWNHRIQRFSLE